MGAGRVASESRKDYLEAIPAITEEKGGVRGKDIAERLGVTTASARSARRRRTRQTGTVRLRDAIERT